MADNVYDVIETYGPNRAIFDKVIFSTYDRVDAFRMANTLNMYFAKYTDDCPIYNVSVRDVLKYPKMLYMPELEYVEFKFDENCDEIETMPMSYSALSKVQDKINNDISSITFSIIDDEYMSFETNGIVKIDVAEVYKDKNVMPDDANRSLLLLKKRAREMVRDIGKTIHDMYGRSLSDIVDETDWCDLNDLFKSALTDVDDSTKVINIDHLYRIANKTEALFV